VIQLDILPSALAAGGTPVKEEWKLDGADLMPYLLGKKAGIPHDTLYWRLGEQMAVRQDAWKLVLYDPIADGQKNSGRATTPKLFNLATDIGETQDLAAQNPEKLKAMQTIWDRWKAEQAPPGGAREQSLRFRKSSRRRGSPTRD
jgi:arylsulfatase A-like enzyme